MKEAEPDTVRGGAGPTPRIDKPAPTRKGRAILLGRRDMKPKSWFRGHVQGRIDLSAMFGHRPEKAPRQKDPLQPTLQDFDNAAHMRHRITHLGDSDLTARWLARTADGQMAYPGTAGSWVKRLRRLEALGWAKRDKQGGWVLTVAGQRASHGPTP